MMLPTLISVSLAPVSYFFCANAVPLMATVAMSAVVNAAVVVVSRESIITPGCEIERSVLPEFAEQVLGNHCDLPCAVRHQEDDKEQQDAEHRAGEAFGNSLRNVRHEDDEGGADDRARQPADAADDHAEEQRDRERNGVAVGRDELHRDRTQAACV